MYKASINGIEVIFDCAEDMAELLNLLETAEAVTETRKKRRAEVRREEAEAKKKQKQKQKKRETVEEAEASAPDSFSKYEKLGIEVIRSKNFDTKLLAKTGVVDNFIKAAKKAGCTVEKIQLKGGWIWVDCSGDFAKIEHSRVWGLTSSSNKRNPNRFYYALEGYRREDRRKK